VARALAADPDLLLMDEPFGALDPGTREALQDEFLRLNAQLRKTVVIVTHDIAEAGRLADEIVLLDRGQIVQRGTLHELLVRPADGRVRGFLGRRVPELVVSVLRLGHILPDLPRAASATSAARPLSADMPLGQALAALAALQDDAVIAVADTSCTAGALRARILADLQAAEGPRSDA
jgi:osmoprotectant transport system ATP-binding protein